MPSQLPDEKNSEVFESVSIWGECGEFSMPGSVWLTVLDIAQLYGWKAAGTDAPDPQDPELDLYIAQLFEVAITDAPDEFDDPAHDGLYYPPNGQKITPEDAKRLAQALERALPDIPGGIHRTDAESQAREGSLMKTARTTERKADPFVGWYEKPSSLMERLGVIRPILQDLIKHCRECGELWIC